MKEIKNKLNIDRIIYLDRRKSFLTSLKESYIGSKNNLNFQNSHLYKEEIKELYRRIDKIDKELEDINNELYNLFELDKFFKNGGTENV